MKAKEYADLYNKDKNIDKVCSMFIGELYKIIEKRNCKRNEACIAVFKELDQKWKAFAKLTNVNPNGFRLLIINIKEFKEILPMIWK